MSTPSSSTLGTVYLVGAGPGDPGLLTVRAVECLQRADLVIHDQLVPLELLDQAPRAERVAVGSLPGPHAQRHTRVKELLIHTARAGKTAVHLKGGDPWLFGRGGEEAAALRAAGIPYEVVPGVTAALAAGISAGIPLTHRDLSSVVTFVTGHDCPGKPAQVDWAALAQVPGTLAIYMGLARLEVTALALIAGGKPPQTPAATVQWAGTGAQKTVTGTLDTIAATVHAAGLTAPVVTLIGPVVGLREDLAWFEQRPLFGRQVLVTRPRGQAGGMVRRFAELGAMVHSLPVLEIGPSPDPGAVDHALDRLGEFNWLVFTSANGVEALLGRLLERGHDLRRLGHLRLAAIGTQTAAALQAFHLRADVVPEEFSSEGLSSSLLPLVAGQRVLLARADRGRPLLFDELSRVATVEQLAVYTQQDCGQLDPHVAKLLRAGRLDFVTLTSSNSARRFLELLGPAEREQIGRSVQLVTISPVTSSAVREAGYEVSAEAREYTAAGVVEAVLGLAGHLSSRRVSMQM